MNLKFQEGMPLLKEVANKSDSPWHRISSFLNLHEYQPDNPGLSTEAIKKLEVFQRELIKN